MAEEPDFELPRDEARTLWRSCLKRLWIEFERAIPEEAERRKLARLPLRECIEFLSVLGAATSPDAVQQAMKSAPRAALTVLQFATMFDEHFEKYPDQFYKVRIGKLVDPAHQPFQLFAGTVLVTLEEHGDRYEKPPAQ